MHLRKSLLNAIRPLTALALAAFAHQAQAADYWWDSNSTTAGFGNTTGTWGTTAFWSTSNAGTATPTAAVTNSADVVNFGTATLNYANATVGIAAGGVTVNSIVYGAGQTTGVTLGTAGNSLTFAGTTPTITVNNGNNIAQTILSPINGSGGLTKSGLGILALSGANVYTGGTTVTGGTLAFRNLASKSSSGTHAFATGTTVGLGVGSGGFTAADVDNAFAGSMTGNLSDVTVNASTTIGIDTTAGSLSYTVPGSPSRGLTKLGTNTLTLNGTNSYTGATTVAGGTLAVNTLANAGANSSIGNFATAGATGLILSGGTFNYTGTSTTTDRGFSTIGSVINTINVGTGVNLSFGASVKNESSAGLTFTASGAGSSITISSLTVAPGTNADYNISTNNPTVTIQNLNVTGNNVIVQRTGSAVVNIGNINGSGSSGWLGNMNVTGVISGYTGELVLGSAFVNLTGLNTFDPLDVKIQQTGIYTINTIKNWGAGPSSFGNPSTAARGIINFGNGGNTPTLKYTGTGGVDGTTNRVLNLRGSGTLNLEQAGTGLLKFTANTTADTGNFGAKTLNLSGSTSGTGEFSGAIVEQNTTYKTSVSKSGTGKWTLSGANTYTGSTTLNGGTLALGANNVLPNTSAVSIGAATLDAATFTDTAGTLAVTAAATINLGSGAALTFADSSAITWPGTLNIIGNLANSSISFGTSASGLTTTQLDKITVNGAGLGDYSLNSSGILILDAGPPDTAAPTPSPMTWASVPATAGNDSITMTATTATDASGVDYFFDETSGNPGGTDSGWQSSSTYTDTGLSPSTTYTYTVTARDRSAALNATTVSASASATTSAPPAFTVWNVQFASQSGNQITTGDNFIGAATENTSNSTWNRVASVPQTAMVLKKSTGENTGVTLDFPVGSIGTQNLNSGAKIFNSRVNGNNTMTLKGLSVTNSYDIVIYSDWWWKNGDALPITQTSGTGLVGTFHLNRVQSGTNGEVLALTRDTNPADVTSGAGNTGNWMRVNGLTPTLAGELAFRITDGNNTPFNGFQLIATPVAPKADMLAMSLASNPPSIRDAVISGTNITLTVPFGTNVTNLAPTFALWPGATCTTLSGTARNFTTPQTYTVTSSDSLVTKNYSVSVVIAPPLPEFTISAPANWNGRTSITAQPVISNLALLQSNNGTNFTYSWSTSGLAVTQTTSPSIMTLTRSQGSGSLLVTLTLNNGTENVTRSTTITVQEPATDPWVERTPLANEKPVANQFFARNPFTNLGTIFYRGTQSGTPDDVFLKVYRTPSGGSETLYSTLRQPLTGGAYDFTAPIEAGLFTYRVVYGTRTSGIDTDLATVNNLLCGDAFIIEGQSNAQATDTGTAQEDISAPWVKTYDSSLGWGPAYARPTSPNWGSKVGFWGMKLAKDIVAQHSMPVCLINGAVGGTYIAQHQPNPANRTVGAGTYDIYANLLNRVIAARLTHGIRGVFWHQGENDASTFGPPLEPDYLSYEQNFLSMSSAWKQDFPNFQRYIVFQIAPNPCGIGPFASEIREVQRQLPRLYSNMSLVNSIAVPGYQGCHYTPAGYESLASRVLPVVNRDFYGVTYSSAVTPPNLVRAYFTSSARTAIALQFDQPMSSSGFSIANWFVNDVADLVSSSSASGNTVTLQLSAAVHANSTLDYVKDTWNYNESVSTLLYGANGIPALTFADVPIDALAPYALWTSSKGLSGLAAAGDADPDNDGVKNGIEFVLGGEPNPANPGSNSTALLPTSSRNPAGDLVFTFKRKLESVGHVDLAFQWSGDLTFPALNTAPIGATSSSFDGVTITISSFDATTENIVIAVPATKALNGRLFGKLRAIAP
jgi:autotransporter-associated beta strand protein